MSKRAIMLLAAIAACATLSSQALAGEVTKSGGMTLAAANVLAGRGAMETAELATIHHVDPATCTTLELDRQTNRTVERPCPREGLALRLEGVDTREDLAILTGADAR